MLRANRSLAKFKFFLTEVQNSVQTGSLTSEVDDLILQLVTSEINPEEFFTRLQRKTDYSFESFHVEIIKSGLPLLQEELINIMPPELNGQLSPRNMLSTSSQEINFSEANGISTPKHQVFEPITNGIEEHVPSPPKQGQVKRITSNSQSLDTGDTTVVNTSTLRRLMRLSESIIPLLEELYDYSTDALGVNAKDFSDSGSNNSLCLNDTEFDGQDQSMSDNTQKETIEFCANCNRRSAFTCVCRKVSYCSAFCQDKDRPAHQRDCLCHRSLVQPVIMQNAIMSNGDPRHPSMITIPNGEPIPMNTNIMSPTPPMQPSDTSIFFQELPLVTPICSIAQPLQ